MAPEALVKRRYCGTPSTEKVLLETFEKIEGSKVGWLVRFPCFAQYSYDCAFRTTISLNEGFSGPVWMLLRCDHNHNKRVLWTVALLGCLSSVMVGKTNAGSVRRPFVVFCCIAHAAWSS